MAPLRVATLTIQRELPEYEKWPLFSQILSHSQFSLFLVVERERIVNLFVLEYLTVYPSIV